MTSLHWRQGFNSFCEVVDFFGSHLCGKSSHFVRKVMDSGTGSSTTSSSQASPAATFVPLLDVASLSLFNPKEDPNTLAIPWKLCKYRLIVIQVQIKRSFNLYLVAKGITKDEQKTTLLLHNGGLNF